MNKINPKTESNFKLLGILAKRKEQEVLAFKKSSWPGQRRPSFMATIHRQLTKRSQSAPHLYQRPKINSMRFSRTIKTSQIVSSSKSLKLIPKTNKETVIKIKNLTERGSEVSHPIISKKAETLEVISRRNPMDDINNYVVDYSAFNYISKVIDTPQLWQRLVHKKTGFQ